MAVVHYLNMVPFYYRKSDNKDRRVVFRLPLLPQQHNLRPPSSPDHSLGHTVEIGHRCGDAGFGIHGALQVGAHAKGAL